MPVRRTLDKLGIPSTTFYRWDDRYQAFSEAGLEDRTSGPGRVWNRIPDNIRQRIVEMALDEPELSPRELAVKFTDEKSYFVSEASDPPNLDYAEGQALTLWRPDEVWQAVPGSVRLGS